MVEALRGADGGGRKGGQGRESGGGRIKPSDLKVFIPDLGEWVNGAIWYFGANGRIMWRVQISRAWAKPYPCCARFWRDKKLAPTCKRARPGRGLKKRSPGRDPLAVLGGAR